MMDSIENSGNGFPRYVTPMLKAAGLYNLLWGAAVILFPLAAFRAFEMELPRYPQIWQCVGMIVGVYGIGYLIAARDPARHWPIVLVGMLGKIFGPVGFLSAAINGELPWSWGLLILFNDLIWWLPFGHTLYLAFKQNTYTGIGRPHGIEDATVLFPSQKGMMLAELSEEQPVMLVFLRHFGCTFCREALSDLGKSRAKIEDMGFAIALIHMSPATEAESLLKNYGLEGLQHYSDPECEIYRAFGLERGSASQLFGPTVVWRGFKAIFQGHGVGTLAGDGFRMPGLFFLFRNEVWGSFRHRTAADRPDYLELCRRADRVLGDEVDITQRTA